MARPFVSPIIPLQLLGHENEQPYTPPFIPNPLYQKKGGVIKAEGGTSVPTEFPWEKNYKSIPQLGRELVRNTESGLLDWRKNATLSEDAQSLFNKNIKRSAADTSFMHQNTGLKGQGGGTAFQSNPNERGYSIDPNQIINLGKAALAYRDLDKQLNNFLGRKRLSYLPLLTNGPQFTSSGAGNAYRNAANNARMFQATSNDPIVN